MQLLIQSTGKDTSYEGKDGCFLKKKYVFEVVSGYIQFVILLDETGNSNLL